MNWDWGRTRALITIAVTAIALSVAVGGYTMGDKTAAGAGVERTSGNRLGGEASLYLCRHARNPVDWQPWGEEALARSRELDRPIFLSIGYASCHWCHVMEEEVFTDAEAAAYLNEHFISIKVDREERPDLDAVYMEAVQAMTGSGGWPLTVFLTPEMKPFFGGTYFPRDTFLELIRRVASVYEDRRDELEQSAETLTSRLGRNQLGKSGDLPGAENVGGAVATALERVDNRWGGFSGRQKFPTPPRWRLMLHQYRKTGQKPIADFLWRSHRGDYGRLVRASTDGLAGAQGILDDYGSTACGLIDLYTATGEVRQLRRALELIESARGLFRGSGGAWRRRPI